MELKRTFDSAIAKLVYVENGLAAGKIQPFGLIRSSRVGTV